MLSSNRDRRRIPSLADEDQLVIERFDDDGNTTGPGLAPVGCSLHALHFLTLFRNGKGLRVGLLRTAAHQFRALIRPAFVWIAVPAALAATKHLDRAIFTAAPEGSELASTPRVVRRPSRIAGERSTRSNGNQN